MNQTIKTLVFLMLAAAVLAGALVLAGCSDDDDPVRVEDDPVTPVPGPESAAELVAQFKAAYGARDVEKYVALLDPDYLMLLSAETTQEFPDVGETLNFAAEERIHQRLFSGKDVTDPHGDFVPAVKAIELLVFQALEGWSPTDDQDHFPGAEWAPFQVVLLFDRGQSYSFLKVNGTVKIYVRAHEVMVGGTNETFYLMAGMVDLTFFGKGTENTSWGSVKALFR